MEPVRREKIENRELKGWARRGLVCAAGFFLTVGYCNGQSLTLKDCIKAAYGLSPGLKAAQLDIDAAGDEIIRQRTALLPSVNASVTAEYIDGYPVSPFAIVTGEDLENEVVGGSTRQVTTTANRTIRTVRGKTLTGETVTTKSVVSNMLPRQLRRADFAPLGLESVTLEYPLFQNGSILGLNEAPAVANARAEKKQLEWTRKLGEERVVYDLCNAFFIAQWYQVKLARDEARVHFSTQRLDIVETQYKLKLMLEQDVELAKAQLEADGRTLAATKQSVKDSWAVLALMIGEPPGKVEQLGGGGPSFPTLPDLAALLERAQAEHPAVGIQETVVEEARAKNELDKAALLPAVNMNTSYSIGENLGHVSTSSADLPTLYTAGVRVDVPIFDWGSKLAEERESRTKIGAEEAREDQVKMDVSTEIAKLYDAIHDIERQFATAVQAKVTDENAAKLARQQRSVGETDQLTLVQAEETLLSAEDTVENTRLAELETYTQLEQAAGGAWRWTQ
jgi:outer membrane protein TolC